MDVMTISGVVENVVKIYKDASKLIQRIKTSRADSDELKLPEEPTDELVASLTLGPMVIEGQYKSSFRRFGESCARGDADARDQMKDVLINLQTALLSELRIVFMDEKQLDFDALLNVSEDSRNTAVSCLAQLYQRMSTATHTQPSIMMAPPVAQSAVMMAPRMPQSPAPAPPAQSAVPYPSDDRMPQTPTSPSLAYSTSRSTHRSYDSDRIPRTPEPLADPLGILSMGSSYADRPISQTSSSHHNVYAAQRECPRPEETISRPLLADSRASEQQRPQQWQYSQPRPDESQLVSEYTPLQPTVTAPQMEPISTSPLQNTTSRSHFDPDDFDSFRTSSRVPDINYDSIYQARRQPSNASRTSNTYSYRSDSTTSRGNSEHVSYLQTNSRPPTHYFATQSQQQQSPPPPQPTTERDSSFRSGLLSSVFSHNRRTSSTSPQPPPTRDSRPSISDLPQVVEIGTTTNDQQSAPSRASRSSISAPIPTSTLRPASSSASRPSITTLASTSSTLSSLSAITTNSSTLSIPSETHSLGFCKGATRLLTPVPKKSAFTLEARPAGMYATIPFWRCSKCSFEGPCFSMRVEDPKGKRGKVKEEKVFDNRVRVSLGGGVRYRWVFLAKSHVTTKAIGEGVRDGSHGTFGCVFCAAEAGSRGWDNGSFGSGTPTFGNVESLMAHLEGHRGGERRPGPVMIEKTRCIVGRTAEDKENFDINLTPVVAGKEDGAAP